eukprot:m.84837 g.84837  ORF g.84837 m.84837 type:complete len:132 (-) comp8220_c0_seq3:68-463(-)
MHDATDEPVSFCLPRESQEELKRLECLKVWADQELCKLSWAHRMPASNILGYPENEPLEEFHLDEIVPATCTSEQKQADEEREDEGFVIVMAEDEAPEKDIDDEGFVILPIPCYTAKTLPANVANVVGECA